LSKETTEIGQEAPDFQATDQDGTQVSLSQFRGKSVVLYFYPKDDTPTCTQQACSFRDFSSDFDSSNAVILGVSGDAAASHQAFIRKYNLPFRLLTDRTGDIRRKFGVGKILGLIPHRTTYIIDGHGIIREVIRLQGDADEHIRRSLSRVRELHAIAL
jgi:peroxiredoxin Q/BCP